MDFLEKAIRLYVLGDYDISEMAGHEGGRNSVYICKRNGIPELILRFSMLGDRTKDNYLAEAEFIHYLAENGAQVADVIPSSNGNLFRTILLSKSAAL